MRDTPEWRNWQTRLTQNQVLRSVGSSPTSGTPRFYIPGVQAKDYPQLRIGKIGKRLSA